MYYLPNVIKKTYLNQYLDGYAKPQITYVMLFPAPPRGKAVSARNCRGSASSRNALPAALNCNAAMAFQESDRPRTRAGPGEVLKVHQKAHEKCAGEAGGKARAEGWRQRIGLDAILLRGRGAIGRPPSRPANGVDC